jgi:MFS family permease
VTDRRTPTGLAAYREVLRTPGAAAFCSAGALARLPMGMLGLGAVLMVVGLGGSYTLAGSVAAGSAIAQGVGAPQVSRLTDRFGQTRVLLPQLAVTGAALAAFILAGLARAPGWVLIVIAVVVGLSTPQIGSLTRVRWTLLLAERPGHDTALAIEGLIDELAFIFGPVLVSLLATLVAPVAGVAAALLITVVGTLLFVAQRRTEPPPAGSRSRKREPGRVLGALIHPGQQVLVAVFLGLGAVFGLIEVALVGFAHEQGRPGSSGLLIGLWSTGSLIAGIVYGGMAWVVPARRRLLAAVAGFAAGAALIWAGGATIDTLTIALLVAGLANAPALIAGTSVVAAAVPESAATEAYTWLNVALFAGSAAGAPVAGWLVDRSGSSAALLGAAVTAAATLGVTALGYRRLPE